MATRTYLVFKENGKEVLSTQIFGNNFWDTAFFTEISKLVGKDCFPECEEPDGAEIESGSNLDSSISKLIALAESNPELKANENVNALIIELEGTENRIMVARQDYVKAVAEYNATIRKFPTSVFAKIFGFKEIQVFQASPESNTVPNVDLK